MSKDELIEFLKENMRLEVSYKHDNQVELQLVIGNEVIDTVSVATDLGSE